MKNAKKIFVAVMMSAVFLFTTSGAVAADQDANESAGGPELISYTISDHVPATSIINKNDTFTLTLNVLDPRIKVTDPPTVPKPSATTNTASFTGGGKRNGTDVKVTTDGCTYTLTFTGLKYTGSGNSFQCYISYTDAAGVPLSLPMAALSLTLNQCVEYVAPEPAPTPDEPDVIIKGTGFILKDASYGSEPIYAGQAFTLNAVLLATNGSAAVENVAVTFLPPEQLTFSEGSSVVYIGTMAPNSSVPVRAVFFPGANIDEGSYSISLDVKGVNQNSGEAVAAQMSVTVPVLQPERFEIFNTQLPTDLTAGVDDGMGYSSITLVNKGKGSVANVSVEITGAGLRSDEGRQFIGNVGSGEQKSAEFNLGADVGGQVDALVIVSYENTRGEQKTLEHPFTVNVMEYTPPDIENPGMFPPEGGEGEESGGGLPGWLWVVIVAAAAAVATIIILRLRKKKLAATEAALDDAIDDDDDDYADNSGGNK